MENASNATLRWETPARSFALAKWSILVGFGLFVSACGGGGGGGSPPAPVPTFTIGGTVAGLAGTGLVLQNNGGDNLSVSASGSFTFSTAISSGSAYTVTVSAQPANPSQTCAVANGSGTATGNIANVTVTCTTNSFTVGATVSGLAGSGLILQNNGGNNLSVTANGAVTFATSVVSGGAYDIRVLTQPSAPNQRCTIANGSGSVAGAAIMAPTIVCVTQVPRFAYGVDYNDASLSIYGVDAATGQLRSRGYVRTGANPTIATSDEAQRFWFVLNRADATLSAYLHDDVTGELAEVAGSPYATGGVGGGDGVGPSGVTVHPNGNFVYVVNASGGNSNNVAAFAINQTTGTLTQVTGSPFAAGTNPHWMTIDASGAFAYVTNRGSNNIYTYSINSTTGALTEVANSRVSTGANPGVLAIHANRRLAYVPNVTDGTISAYAVNPTTGVLNVATGGSASAGANPATLVILHPSGKFLYIRSAGPVDMIGTMAAYSINQTTGALTLIGAVTIGANSNRTAMDPAGKFLFVANRGIPLSNPVNGSIAAFSIDQSTGALTSLTGIFGSNMPTSPSSVSVDPSGQYVYVTSTPGNAYYSYSLNTTSGALTALSRGATMIGRDQPVSLTAYGSVSTPTAATFRSKFAYATNGSGNSISGYAAHATSGALTSVGAATVTSAAPQAVAAHPSGKFLFSANTTAPRLITPHAINATTGVLTSNAASGAAGNAPVAVVVESSGRFVYTANSVDSTISVHAINRSTGTLTAVGTPAATILGSLVDIAITPSGRFLYAISSTSMGWWSINATTGALAGIGGGAAGGANVSLGMDPNGRSMYLSTGTGIARYTLNPYTGVPVLVGNDILTAVGSLNIDPTGRFMYTANGAANNVSGFSIDQQTGLLAQLTGSPFSMGALANTPSLAIDYGGKFLYALINHPSAPVVGLYSIGTSGTLAGILPDVPTGAVPSRITVTKDMQ